MKKVFMLTLCCLFALTCLANASEYTLPYWEKTPVNNTFLAIVNPSSQGVNSIITIKGANGERLYVTNRYLMPGKQFIIDTAMLSLSVSTGTIHIFVYDSAPGTPIAITAMIYGSNNVALQVSRY